MVVLDFMHYRCILEGDRETRLQDGHQWFFPTRAKPFRRRSCQERLWNKCNAHHGRDRRSRPARREISNDEVGDLGVLFVSPIDLRRGRGSWLIGPSCLQILHRWQWVDALQCVKKLTLVIPSPLALFYKWPCIIALRSKHAICNMHPWSQTPTLHPRVSDAL